VEAVPLYGRTDTAIDAEAREKECEYLLFLEVTQKKRGGGFGRTMRIVGTATSIASGEGSNLFTILSHTNKPHDELTFTYRVLNVKERNVKLANTVRAKARKAGQDLLGPQIEKAAIAIGSGLKQN
jgi:hypothetical protein